MKTKDFADLEKKINIEFNNKDILKNALVHRSFVNENKDKIEHNERLEFLGDAVLELIVTEYLYANFPDRTEGELTSFRAALVRTESLASTAEEIGLGDYIFMSKGEESTGGRKRPYILANTFEAILGAIYIDQGYEKSKEYILDKLVYKINDIVEKRLDIDNKSRLQEISQEVHKITPIYELVSEDGPDHEKVFTMRVLIGEVEYGQGKGANKQEAAQKAAASALENWDKIIKDNE